VTKAIEDEAKRVEAQKVGAITSGTVILTPNTKPQAIYVYLPIKNNKGLLWLQVHSPYPSQDPRKPNDTGVRLSFDNSIAMDIDRAEETPYPLNDLFERGAKEKAATHREKFDPVNQIPTITASQMMAPVQTRLSDIHSITFEALSTAFPQSPTPNAEIRVSYLVLISPTITLDK
jgi:hypothetical protein